MHYPSAPARPCILDNKRGMGISAMYVVDILMYTILFAIACVKL